MVDVDEYVTGTRIVVSDAERIAQLIALVLMGQAVHAQTIIGAASVVTPYLDTEALRADAKSKLAFRSDAQRWHRDGLLLEILSWIAANEAVQGECLLKDPHLKATTQGLDGLMIEFNSDSRVVERVVIFEDKCSGDPREAFRDKTLPGFRKIHGGERASELLSATVALLCQAGLSRADAMAAASVSQDPSSRTYRAGLAVEDCHDSTEARQRLFDGFDTIAGLTSDQRVGASYVTIGGLRTWFDNLAARVEEQIERGRADVRR